MPTVALPHGQLTAETQRCVACQTLILRLKSQSQEVADDCAARVDAAQPIERERCRIRVHASSSDHLHHLFWERLQKLLPAAASDKAACASLCAVLSCGAVSSVAAVCAATAGGDAWQRATLVPCSSGTG